MNEILAPPPPAVPHPENAITWTCDACGQKHIVHIGAGRSAGPQGWAVVHRFTEPKTTHHFCAECWDRAFGRKL